MTRSVFTKVVTGGAVTGMRSMSGAAALAMDRGAMLGRIVPALAAAEMMADKTSLVPDRIDPLPLAGRAVLGALVGGVIAGETEDGAWAAGALLGATAAVMTAHLAYQVRRRLPLPGAIAGMLEDALVVTLARSIRAGRSGGR